MRILDILRPNKNDKKKGENEQVDVLTDLNNVEHELDRELERSMESLVQALLVQKIVQKRRDDVIVPHRESYRSATSAEDSGLSYSLIVEPIKPGEDDFEPETHKRMIRVSLQGEIRTTQDKSFFVAGFHRNIQMKVTSLGGQMMMTRLHPIEAGIKEGPRTQESFEFFTELGARLLQKAVPNGDEWDPNDLSTSFQKVIQFVDTVTKDIKEGNCISEEALHQKQIRS